MRIAIVGSGQLARMLALAGLPLGYQFSFLVDTGADTDTRCVDGLGDLVFLQPGMTADVLYEELGSPDVLTFEKEQCNIEPLRGLQELTRISPSFDAIACCQNRHGEKQLLQKLQIPSSPFVYATEPSVLQQAVEDLGTPLVVKSISEGYDGKNQWRINSADDLAAVPADMLARGVIAEQWIPFLAEASLVGARRSDGECVFYPLAENTHRQGILVKSVVPASENCQRMTDVAVDYLQRIMEELNYVGVMAMECFVCEDELLVNELAPRVHNSGHWSQDGALCSQFENHLRAITGLTLGATENLGFAGMVNILGPNSEPQELLSAQSTLHWYNKTIRPGRKQGHVNFLTESGDELQERMQTLSELLV